MTSLKEPLKVLLSRVFTQVAQSANSQRSKEPKVSTLEGAQRLNARRSPKFQRSKEPKQTRKSSTLVGVVDSCTRICLLRAQADVHLKSFVFYSCFPSHSHSEAVRGGASFELDLGSCSLDV